MPGTRISDVVTTISVPRRRIFTSGSRGMPRPSPVVMSSDASLAGLHSRRMSRPGNCSFPDLRKASDQDSDLRSLRAGP